MLINYNYNYNINYWKIIFGVNLMYCEYLIFLKKCMRVLSIIAIMSQLFSIAHAGKDSLYYVTTLAGDNNSSDVPNNNSGYADGTGTAATFQNPRGINAGPDGNLYVADSSNNLIRQIASGAVVSTIVGSESLNNPYGLAFDGTNNLYVTDSSNNCIQIITYAAGSWSLGTPITGFNCPQGIVLNSAGDTLYVADTANNRICQITLPNGDVSTIAGGINGNAFGYQDGIGTVAIFGGPYGIAIDSLNNLYVADSGNNLIRKLTCFNGDWVVSTFAGSVNTSTGHADGTGIGASFNDPSGITCGALDILYVSDAANNTIRKITPAGVVTTIAGTTANTVGFQDGPGLVAQMNSPQGLTMDNTGKIYVCDTQNNLIRQISPNYFGPEVIDTALTSSDYGTEPITFAGGIMQVAANLTLSNDLILLAPSIINTNGYNVHFSGATTGTAALTIIGGGSVNFSSSYNGATTNQNDVSVVTGTQHVSQSSVPGNSVTYFLSGTAPELKVTASVDIYNVIALGTNGTIDANGYDVSFYGAIIGPGGMTFTDSIESGSITLNGVNTYTGSTTINIGTTVRGDISHSASVAVNSVVSGLIGTYDLNGAPRTLNDVSGGGMIKDPSGNDAVTLNSINGSTFSGTFDDSLGGVSITGQGVLALSGSNGSYANGITINGGALNIASVASIGTGSLTLNGGILQVGASLTITNAITLDASAIIDTNGYTVDLSGSSIEDGGFNLAIIGGGTVRFPSSYAGVVTVGTGSHAYAGNSGATALTSAVAGYNLAPSGAQALIMNDSGILSLTTSNDYTGGTIIQDGTVNISNNNALSTGTVYFYASGRGTTTLQVGASGLTMSNPIQLMTNGTINTNGYTLISTGAICGVCSLMIESISGAGTLVLAGANTYSGGTTINPGTLNISSSNNIGTGILALNGGTLQAGAAFTLTQAMTLTANSTLDTGGYDLTLSGRVTLGTYTLNVLNGGSVTFIQNIIATTGHVTYASSDTTIDVASNTIRDYSQVITVSSGSALHKTNTGTLHINANNAATLLGTVDLDAGILEVDHVTGTVIDALGTTGGADNILNMANGTTLQCGSSLAAVNATSSALPLPIHYAGSVTINTSDGSASHALTTNAIVCTATSGQNHINVTGGGIYTPSAAYTASVGGIDMLNVTGSGTTVNLTDSTFVPPTLKLGNGTVLKASGVTLPNITVG